MFRITQAISFSLLLIVSTSTFAIPVTLVGAVADPYNFGYVPVPSNDPASLTTNELAAISDLNVSTGYTFDSVRGEYSSNASSVVGFGLRFDFDISSFESIQSVDFTWTGAYSWTGLNLTRVRLGPETSMPLTTISFGSGYVPDGTTRTATIAFSEGGSGFSDLNYVLDGDRMSFWVSTDLGFSTTGATVDNVQLTTFEVSANAFGTQGSPVAVAEPETVWLMSLGLVGLVAAARRKRNPA